MIDLRDITMAFPDGTSRITAVDGVSLHLAAGETVGITPNLLPSLTAMEQLEVVNELSTDRRRRSARPASRRRARGSVSTSPER
jgi:hypothetical protein